MAHTTLEKAWKRKRSGRPIWEWFENRVRTHHESTAGLPARYYRGEDACRMIDLRLESANGMPSRMMYLHIPFCRRICSFCSFFRRPPGLNLEPYAQTLEKQIDAVAATVWGKSRPFDAVYFGGGTPTALSAKLLSGLVRRIRQRFDLTPNCEFTVEARFDGVDAEYLRQLRESGVNRMSFGLQTFQTDLRRRVGRLADRDAILALLQSAGDLGFDSISVDLIYNLPGQTEEMWSDDLAALQSTPVTGASIYSLVPFPGSPMMRAIEQGLEFPLGGIDAEYRFFSISDRMLRSGGDWKRLSPFHFGRSGKETSVYNSTRLGRADVLGLGCGAGGSIHGMGYMHEMNIPKYLQSSTDWILPVMACSERDASIRPLMKTYDLFAEEGICTDVLFECVPSFRDSIRQMLEMELLTENAGQLRLTPEGCFWAYNLIAALTSALSDTAHSFVGAA